MISPARRAAFTVLMTTEEGGYASDLLLARTANLDSRDAGLACEIVFGCLRRQAQLDFLVRQATRREPGKLDAAVRISLRMGLYQLRHLDRVPPHAALNESVELVKAAKKSSAAGLVNAILRRAPRGTAPWPDRSTELSMPAWLLQRWDSQWDRKTSDRIATAFLASPELYVRNPPPDSGLHLEATSVPGGFRVVSGDASGVRIQDVGSQSVVPLLELGPGQTFLDVCAAPGNKTAQALESGVRAIACDLHWKRLQTVTGCSRVVMDASQAIPFRLRFDRILVDAPCSGTGTLGRNPEIRWRLRPEDLEELHERQYRILKNSLELLAAGGKLVYSTCSLEKRENEEVVERVMAETGHRQLHASYRIPGREPGDGFFTSVLVPN